MKNKDYREIQLSSSQLTLIFLAILVLGVVIFLLGVSVGKKQAQLVKETETTSPVKTEPVEEKPAVPAQKTQDAISEELASHQKIKEDKEKKPSEIPRKNLYYIQIAAVNRKEAALSFAEQFIRRGYPAKVFDPFPTDKKDVFRVRIGGYETKEEAEKILAKLNSEAKKEMDYFIIRS